MAAILPSAADRYSSPRPNWGACTASRWPVATAQPVTPAFGSAAAPVLSPHGHWLLYVHSYEGQDALALVDVDGGHWPVRLVSGEDFYMQPCWHPDGRRIAWVAWNHPNMPWDGTWLRLGKLALGENGLPALHEITTVAGDEHTSIFQPQFSPDGRWLVYALGSQRLVAVVPLRPGARRSPPADPGPR